jgi:hypothetical protein
MELTESKQVQDLFNEALNKVDMGQVSQTAVIADVLEAINQLSFRLMVSSAILQKLQANESQQSVQATGAEEPVNS